MKTTCLLVLLLLAATAHAGGFSEKVHVLGSTGAMGNSGNLFLTAPDASLPFVEGAESLPPVSPIIAP